jgi:aryl-alcohol dehydrogenase-like predicted oxidoreductase
MKKPLLLGTAAWGWTVDRATAFSLLDAWLAAGWSEIDAATNYPINRVPADFRASENILAEYVAAHGLQRELAVTMKVGAMDNLRSPDVNLAPSFLRMMADEYRRVFGGCLRGLTLHWDNRSDEASIRASLEVLADLQREGLQPGLSGIAHPDVYARVHADLGLAFDIQLKHNVFHTDLPRYQPLLGGPTRHRLLAYGLNAGGVKMGATYQSDSTLLLRGGQPDQYASALVRLEQWLPEWNASVRPPLRTVNHLGLLNAALHPQIGGAIVGVRSVAQLTETLEWWHNLEVFDYQDVFKRIVRLDD